MFEKDLHISLLLDIYGSLLTERKRGVLDMYYNEDFSLAEVAEQVGISRQGVRDIIRKTGEELQYFENKLGLAKRNAEIEKCADEILSLCKEGNLTQNACAVVSLAESIKKQL